MRWLDLLNRGFWSIAQGLRSIMVGPRSLEEMRQDYVDLSKEVEELITSVEKGSYYCKKGYDD